MADEKEKSAEETVQVEGVLEVTKKENRAAPGSDEKWSSAANRSFHSQGAHSPVQTKKRQLYSRPSNNGPAFPESKG